VKTLTDRKESSHVSNPDYESEITLQGEALATFEDKVFPWKLKIGLAKAEKT
jgi:hypothetical protein